VDRRTLAFRPMGGVFHAGKGREKEGGWEPSVGEKRKRVSSAQEKKGGKETGSEGPGTKRVEGVALSRRPKKKERWRELPVKGKKKGAGGTYLKKGGKGVVRPGPSSVERKLLIREGERRFSGPFSGGGRGGGKKVPASPRRKKKNEGAVPFYFPQGKAGKKTLPGENKREKGGRSSLSRGKGVGKPHTSHKGKGQPLMMKYNARNPSYYPRKGGGGGKKRSQTDREKKQKI